jgi:MoxR-like ATPase
MDQLTPLLTADVLTAMQDMVAATYMKESVIRYVVDLICATRNHPEISRGASPRATLAMTAMAKSIAQIQGRDYVIPADVQTVFITTIAHRLLMAPSAEAKGVTAETVLRSILSAVRVPPLN